MPRTLKLKDVAKQIKDTENALKAATKVEKLKADGSVGAQANPQNVKDAVKALKSADQMLRRVCQQGVFGVKVSP